MAQRSAQATTAVCAYSVSTDSYGACLTRLETDSSSAAILVPLADNKDCHCQPPAYIWHSHHAFYRPQATLSSATMAPTPSPIPVYSPNHPSGRHIYHFRRDGLNFLRHPPRRPAPSRTELFMARTLSTTPQPSMVFESPPPPPVAPTPSESVALAPEPSAIPANNDQPQQPNQFIDIPGNIVAAVIVIVLILGGLIGLIIGGETLRRQVRNTEKRRVSPPPARCFGLRKSKPTKKTTSSPQTRTPTSREKFPYDEKTLTPLMRPPPVRERQRRLSDVWPIRSLSRAMMYDRRSCPEQVERSLQHTPPRAGLQTTWSEFSPVSPYVALPRTVLASIPEEREDCQSQTHSDFAVMLGVALGQSLERGSVVPTNDLESSHKMALESSVAAERCDSQHFQIIHKAEARDEDAKSLGSSAPDMTSDGGESSRSSMVSLESLENDRESLGEEVFELRRAQTRSMQMNKGVLLSLSLKTLDDSPEPEITHVECGPSRSPSVTDAEGGKDYDVLSLGMLGGNFSAVNLDEFPSPPSILPMIPSFVSGF